MKVRWIELEQHQGVAASPPGALPRLQGVRIVEALALGEASRMGSTPPSKVIAVGAPFGPPSVATTMTASPFCKSARVAAGMRLIAGCRSGAPPGRTAVVQPMGAPAPDSLRRRLPHSAPPTTSLDRKAYLSGAWRYAEPW